MVIAWTGGRNSGLLLAALATLMWVVADVVTEQQFSAAWIPWANALTRLMTYCLVVLLIAQLRLQLKREHDRATQDALTELQNRRAFLDAGATESERSKRYGHPMAVAFLDLDDFKLLNDSRGHAAGDAALQATATALQEALRASDQIARLGGDEFAIILPETTENAAIQVAQKLYDTVNNALRAFSPVTASVGIAWFETIDQDFPAMLKAADELMYEAKQGGKNNLRMRCFTAASKAAPES
jgi:diguanylate cyclase (GGDEF)-like protein